MGFIGVFDIDFFQSGNVFYFCEINLRYGGSGYAITKMGVNLPAMMVKSFIGTPIDNINNSITGEGIYVNERMCMEDLYNGYISIKEYFEIKKKSDVSFIKDEEDKSPQRAYMSIFWQQIIKRFLLKIKHIIC